MSKAEKLHRKVALNRMTPMQAIREGIAFGTKKERNRILGILDILIDLGFTGATGVYINATDLKEKVNDLQ